MADHAGLGRLDLARQEVDPNHTPSAVYAQAATSLLLGTTVIVAVFRIPVAEFGRSSSGMWLALAIYIVIAVVAVAKLPTHPHRRFGAANVVTTLRAAATAAIGGVVLGSEAFHDSSMEQLQWTIASGTAIALSLDGLDGYLARRSGTASRFGARFDMEIDALLILLLATGIALLDKAGAWVLLLGLMRYGFVAAQALSARLSGDLPESMRRKAICVFQGIALCVSLVPMTPPATASALLLLALSTLLYSFVVDIGYLWKTGGAAGHDA